MMEQYYRYSFSVIKDGREFFDSVVTYGGTAGVARAKRMVCALHGVNKIDVTFLYYKKQMI